MKWQPIETAPKDGTRILAARNGRVEVLVWNEDRYSKVSKPYWTNWTALGKTWERDNGPTHWMPLPDLPEAVQ